MTNFQSDRPEAKPLRLFIAVDLPPGVRAELDARIGPLRTSVPGARWTKPEGWHVTLVFLGSTVPIVVPRISEAVRATATAAPVFETRLTALGAFPSAGRARVLWAGLDDPDGRFVELVKHLYELLADVVEPEKRVFTPHLTGQDPAAGAADRTGVGGARAGSGVGAVRRRSARAVSKPPLAARSDVRGAVRGAAASLTERASGGLLASERTFGYAADLRNHRGVSYVGPSG
jgi:2'-5' RNA ligase